MELSGSAPRLVVRVRGHHVVGVGGHAIVFLARLLRRVHMYHGRIQVIHLVRDVVVDLAGHGVPVGHREEELGPGLAA